MTTSRCGLALFALPLVLGCSSDDYEDSSTHHGAFAAWPNALAADDDALYVAAGSLIEKRDADGANASTLTDGEPAAPTSDGRGIGTRDLTIAGDYLYWIRWPVGSDAFLPGRTSTSSLVRMAKAGGTPEVLSEPSSAYVSRYVVTKTQVVACANASASGGPSLLVASIDAAAKVGAFGSHSFGRTLDRCADLFVDGAGQVHLALAISGADAWFTVDASGVATPEATAPVRPGVAWVQDAAGTKARLTLTKADGSKVVLATDYPQAFAFDGTVVTYMSGIGGGNQGSHLCETAEVSSVREGQSPKVLTRGQCGPTAFASTKRRVFWLDDQSILNRDVKAETVLKSVSR